MYNLLAISTACLLMVSCTTAMMIEGKQMSMDDAIMKAGSNGSMSKMFEIMQDKDTVMVELDMLFKMETYNEMVKDMVPIDMDSTKEAGGSRKKRKAIRSSAYRWTNQRVPYEISYEFSTRDRSVINDAINDYHRYTCLRFVPASSSDRNRVRFQNGGGCSSYVGMIGNTQPISLAQGCRYKGIVIHEMGHAIGFQHEQTRPDRDTYVYIDSRNIQRGVEYNFMKYTTSQVNNYNVPYDYRSVMHYSGTAFSANGQRTIVARQPEFQNVMGNREGFSFKDIQLANTMYDCAGVNNCAARDCAQGFQGPDCKCWCDSGDTRNPVKECDGSGPAPASTTTPTPTRPMNCEDLNRNCEAWADYGFCRDSRYESYMSRNCPYSCNVCPAPTTTTTTTQPTVSGCRDENTYCSYWADRGECSRNPSYMLNNCKVSCNACENGERTCEDMNDSCPSWTRYCNYDTYRSYLADNCMKSCGYCTPQDEDTGTTTPSTNKQNSKCMDRRETSWCTTKAGKCSWHSRIRYLCEKTCGIC